MLVEPPVEFLLSDFILMDIVPEKCNFLLRDKSLSESTIETFRKHFNMVHYVKWGPSNRNYGFPLIDPSDGTIKGFELINRYLNLYAPGSMKESTAWIVPFGGMEENIKVIYCFHSPLDLMSYYELFKNHLDFSNSVMISINENFNSQTIKSIMKRFPNAEFQACFDNDIRSNLSEINLASLFHDLDFNYARKGDGWEIQFNNESLIHNDKILTLRDLEILTSMEFDLCIHRAQNAIDFNQMLKNSKVRKRRKWIKRS